MRFLQGLLALRLALAPMAVQPDVTAQAIAAARTEIGALVAASGGDVAVAWRPLDASPRSAEQLLMRADARYHAASTMKIPVMIELFRRVAAHELSLDDTLVVSNRFHSIVDGSPYELSATEDADGESYKSIGTTVTLRALCESMITISSNLAANTLIEKLGAKNIQATVDRLGASGMQVLRGVEDQKAFDKGLNNSTDAMALLTLFHKLGRGEIVSRAASAEMVGILERQRLNDGIPAGLPAGTIVAHKTGTITKVHHDAGIVYGKRPYVLVVLVGGIEDEKVSAKLIADIAKAVNGIEK